MCWIKGPVPFSYPRSILWQYIRQQPSLDGRQRRQVRIQQQCEQHFDNDPPPKGQGRLYLCPTILSQLPMSPVPENSRLSLEYGRYPRGRRRSLILVTAIAFACLSFLAGMTAVKNTLSALELCVLCGSAGLFALAMAANDWRFELRAAGRSGKMTRCAVAMSLALGFCGPLFAKFDSPFHRWPVYPAIICLPGLRTTTPPSPATRATSQPDRGRI